MTSELCSRRSEMAQQISANDLAESVMAFNTNYSDSGLFGVYAVAKVRFSINRVAHL
jgi:predicted Zn-dependent peptidase